MKKHLQSVEKSGLNVKETELRALMEALQKASDAVTKCGG